MTQYIAIKDAADISGKSVQTIRRMIKAKKLKYRKDRTPQGFNYLVDLDSLKEQCKVSAAAISEISISEPTNNQAKAQETVSKVKPVDLDLRAAKDEPKTEQAEHEVQETAITQATQERNHQQIVSYEPVKEFTDTMQKLIEQHGKEKENLFRLIETFQNKVISLENKIKVETNSSPKWFKFW